MRKDGVEVVVNTIEVNADSHVKIAIFQMYLCFSIITISFSI
jgi:hypothetical protein